MKNKYIGQCIDQKCKRKVSQLFIFIFATHSIFNTILSFHIYHPSNYNFIHSSETTGWQIYFYYYSGKMKLSLFLSDYEPCLLIYLYSSNCPLLKVCHWIMLEYIIKHYGNDSCKAEISFFICLISITLFNFPRSLPLACVTILLGARNLANN